MRDRFPQLFELSVEEKLQLVEELWDDIADHHADEIPIPKELIEEVERRHASFLQNPTDVLTWQEIEEDILSGHAYGTDRPA
jgi:putative addiction module component (TIGR02574 family)